MTCSSPSTKRPTSAYPAPRRASLWANKPNLATNNGTTEDLAIQLTNPEAFAWYAYKLNTTPSETISGSTTYANANVKLTANIDLTGVSYGGSLDTTTGITPEEKHQNALKWVPMGSAANPFTGTFAGTGTRTARTSISHLTISQAAENAALFSVVGNAKFSGLSVESGFVATTETNSGAASFVGQVLDGSTLTITDCNNSADISSAGFFAGGLVANVEGDTAGIVMERCSNKYGTITAENRAAGGLLGYMGGNSLRIIDSYSTGSVTADARTGGVLGSIEEDVTGSFLIANCYSMGAITSTSTNDVHGHSRTLGNQRSYRVQLLLQLHHNAHHKWCERRWGHRKNLRRVRLGRGGVLLNAANTEACSM